MPNVGFIQLEFIGRAKRSSLRLTTRDPLFYSVFSEPASISYQSSSSCNKNTCVADNFSYKYA